MEQYHGLCVTGVVSSAGTEVMKNIIRNMYTVKLDLKIKYAESGCSG